MRLRKSVFPVIFCAIFFAAALANIKSASAATVLAISPEIVYRSVGETFKVNVTVSSVDYLYDWQANITFNPTVLRVVDITEGEFLARQPEGTVGGETIETSWALFAWATVGQYVGESGSGTLATVEFEVLAEGESLIEFSDPGDTVDALTILESQSSPNPPPNFEYVTFEVQNSIFVNTVDPPVATFTFSPLVPGIGETITFDASASSAVEPNQITEYFWDFGDETNATVTNPVVEHSYASGGSYLVSLTVMDDTEAPDLVQSTYGTVGMPRVWYELFGTTAQSISVSVPHDIAVTSVSASDTEVTAGEAITVTAKVLNIGTETESFSVKAYYGVNEISTKQVSDLQSGDQETLVFDWSTSGVPEGTYQIIVEVPAVEGETNVGNNKFIDGTVKVNPGGSPFPIELMIGGAVVAIILVVGLGMFLRRRGRQS